MNAIFLLCPVVMTIACAIAYAAGYWPVSFVAWTTVGVISAGVAAVACAPGRATRWAAFTCASSCIGMYYFGYVGERLDYANGSTYQVWRFNCVWYIKGINTDYIESLCGSRPVILSELYRDRYPNPRRLSLVFSGSLKDIFKEIPDQHKTPTMITLTDERNLTIPEQSCFIFHHYLCGKLKEVDSNRFFLDNQILFPQYDPATAARLVVNICPDILGILQSRDTLSEPEIELSASARAALSYELGKYRIANSGTDEYVSAIYAIRRPDRPM